MRLESHKVDETIDLLRLRIAERFPATGLLELANELQRRARETAHVAHHLGRPIWAVRCLSMALIAAFAASLSAIVFSHDLDGSGTANEWVQVVDASGNVLILLGLGSAFLWNLELGLRRRRVIAAINRLRDLAHVVDMKQLTKDPRGLPHISAPTPHSPRRVLNAYLLGRYLDYCAEALSLISKLGYLYISEFDDPVATKAVNELEGLCTGLSAKIWQKIMTLPATALKETATA